jgi:hypothetical protein
MRCCLMLGNADACAVSVAQPAIPSPVKAQDSSRELPKITIEAPKPVRAKPAGAKSGNRSVSDGHGGGAVSLDARNPFIVAILQRCSDRVLWSDGAREALAARAVDNTQARAPPQSSLRSGDRSLSSICYTSILAE